MRRANHKAFWVCFVCILLLFPMFSGLALADSVPIGNVRVHQTGPYAVSSGAVYVRSGPGTGFWVLTTLTLNEIVPILNVSPDGGWWYVRTPIGEGWVANISVTAHNTGTVTVRDPGPIGVVIAYVLNVREGAGPTAYRLGYLNKGEQVYIIGRNADGTWLQIRWVYGTGWVYAPEIAVSGGTVGITDGSGGFAGPADDADNVAVTASEPFGIVMVTYLNVRNGPSINYSILGQVYSGQELRIVGRSADSQWYQVETSFGTGWVFADYLITRNEFGASPVTTDDSGGAAELVGPIGIVNTGALNLRSGPGPQYTVVGTLAGAAQGVIIGRNADWSWWLMDTPAGIAWASSPYIIVRGDTFGVPYAEPDSVIPSGATQPGGAAPAAEIALPEAIVNSGALHIRSGPNGAFPSLGAVERGVRMPILGQSPDHGWWLVDSPFGEGWVSKLYVITSGDTSGVPVK